MSTVRYCPGMNNSSIIRIHLSLKCSRCTALHGELPRSSTYLGPAALTPELIVGQRFIVMHLRRTSRMLPSTELNPQPRCRERATQQPHRHVSVLIPCTQSICIAVHTSAAAFRPTTTTRRGRGPRSSTTFPLSLSTPSARAARADLLALL